MNKVNKYANSKEGKSKVKTIIDDYVFKGVNKTDEGSEILTKAKMTDLTIELIDIIKRSAKSCDLPDSVMAHFDSLDYIVQDLDDNKFEFCIYFKEDLSRESLETSYNQGEGINNIIALFNNGYVASAPKYGWWNGHAPSGESVYRSGVGDTSAYIQGMQARPSLLFMQRAVSDFYNKYKNIYPINIILNDDYVGHYNGSLNGVIRKIK